MMGLEKERNDGRRSDRTSGRRNREEGCFKGRRRRWSVQADGYGVEGESKGGCGGNREERKVVE